MTTMTVVTAAGTVLVSKISGEVRFHISTITSLSNSCATLASVLASLIPGVPTGDVMINCTTANSTASVRRLGHALHRRLAVTPINATYSITLPTDGNVSSAIDAVSNVTLVHYTMVKELVASNSITNTNDFQIVYLSLPSVTTVFYVATTMTTTTAPTTSTQWCPFGSASALDCNAQIALLVGTIVLGICLLAVCVFFCLRWARVRKGGKWRAAELEAPNLNYRIVYPDDEVKEAADEQPGRVTAQGHGRATFMASRMIKGALAKSDKLRVVWDVSLDDAKHLGINLDIDGAPNKVQFAEQLVEIRDIEDDEFLVAGAIVLSDKPLGGADGAGNFELVADVRCLGDCSSGLILGRLPVEGNEAHNKDKGNEAGEGENENEEGESEEEEEEAKAEGKAKGSRGKGSAASTEEEGTQCAEEGARTVNSAFPMGTSVVVELPTIGDVPPGCKVLGLDAGFLYWEIGGAGVLKSRRVIDVATARAFTVNFDATSGRYALLVDGFVVAESSFDGAGNPEDAPNTFFVRGGKPGADAVDPSAVPGARDSEAEQESRVCVTRVLLDGDHLGGEAPPPEKVPLGVPAFQDGEVAEYWSTSNCCWMSAHVNIEYHDSRVMYTAVIRSGPRPQTPLSCLRLPLRAGEPCECYSKKMKGWYSGIVIKRMQTYMLYHVRIAGSDVTRKVKAEAIRHLFHPDSGVYVYLGPKHGWLKGQVAASRMPCMPRSASRPWLDAAEHDEAENDHDSEVVIRALERAATLTQDEDEEVAQGGSSAALRKAADAESSTVEVEDEKHHNAPAGREVRVKVEDHDFGDGHGDSAWFPPNLVRPEQHFSL
eukprot:NODE_112_length_3622_cov_6.806581.p1 GENE.NODE_112_length_3622_cov_6.806581~~NODE_112_length_3622_cov_6.806581.p1  ORF type:complete len:864 (+),score=224.62 NODE_112_length_3622_cov_6.806581:111-2594(+)